MALFTKADEERIEAAIAAVEQRTSAEIVVVTVDSSDSYGAARLAAALVVGLACSGAAALAWPLLPHSFVLGLQALVVALVWLASRIPIVLRWLLPDAMLERAVQRRAALAFLEHSVFKTQDRTGVLILVSELEHEVAMLGDEGIHGLLAQAGWNELVAQLLPAIRGGRGAEGLCRVIERLGETLAAAPPRQGDVNELENRVRSDGHAGPR